MIGRRASNNSGASLIQVLVATGIMVLIGSIVMQTVIQMREMEVAMATNLEVTQLETGIQRILMTPQACMNTLYAKLPIKDDDFPVALTAIHDDTYNFAPGAVNVPFLKLGDRVANHRLRAEKITLTREYRKPGGTIEIVDITPNAVVRVFLEVIFVKWSEALAAVNPGQGAVTSLGGSRIVRRIPISVQTNEHRQITGCTSLNQFDVATKICQDLDGQLDPVTKVCSLKDSQVIVKAICDTLGMNSNGSTCY